MFDRRISLLALFLLTAGCGGGGSPSGGATPPVAGPSPSPGPAPSPSPQTGSISGTISSIAGVPLQGVQLLTSGTGSVSTATNSAGSYSFVGLAPGSYSVEPRAGGLIFSPLASTVSVVANADIRANFTATYQSTGTIAGYMASLQSQLRDTFSAKESALSALLAAAGSFQSGAHYSRSISENFLPMVDSFISSSTQFIQSLRQSDFIDSKAVSELFKAYSAADVEFSRAYYSGVNWGLSASGLTQILADLKSQIDLKYAVPISQFQ